MSPLHPKWEHYLGWCGYSALKTHGRRSTFGRSHIITLFGIETSYVSISGVDVSGADMSSDDNCSCLTKQVCNSMMIFVQGSLERVAEVAALSVDVGARLEQQLHDLLLSAA